MRYDTYVLCSGPCRAPAIYIWRAFIKDVQMESDVEDQGHSQAPLEDSRRYER